MKPPINQLDLLHGISEQITKLVVWNTEWAVSGSKRGLLLSEQIQRQQPDVICLTEAQAELLPQQGHVIEPAPAYGYPLKPGRRKVILWSKHLWSEVSIHEHHSFPSPGYEAW